MIMQRKINFVIEINKLKMDFFYRTWKAFAWALFVFIISAIPGQEIEPYAIWNVDKLVHSFIYYILTILLTTGFQKQDSLINFRRNAIMIAFYIAVLYGGILEVLQDKCFINRSGNIPDFLANTFGAALAMYTYPLILKIKFLRRLL